MNTPARISIQNKDGSLESIYCHENGDPSNLGKMLLDFYVDEARIRALIDLGSIQYLAPYLEPLDDPHSLKQPASGVTVAYTRDGGEAGSNKRLDIDTGKFLTNASEPFVYMFIPVTSKWLFKRPESPAFSDLTYAQK